MMVAGGRDCRVLDQHVEATKLLANLFRSFCDRGLIRHVQLKRMGSGPNLLGRGLAQSHDYAGLERSKRVNHAQAARPSNSTSTA